MVMFRPGLGIKEPGASGQSAPLHAVDEEGGGLGSETVGRLSDGTSDKYKSCAHLRV